jgi:ABC-type transporter Mla MlaB component
MPGEAPHRATLALSGSPARAELERVLERAAGLLAERCAVLELACTGLEPDLAALEALARIGLLARRRGCSVRLLGASEPLLELIELAGLGEALGASRPRGVGGA